MQRRGSEEWRRKYGLRWIAESAFSWIKRVFGEYVTAKKFENMIREIIQKALLYNLLIGMTKRLKRKASKQEIEGTERIIKY